ncbi:hypothetical protein ACFY2V_27430 [Streptomyces eurythermus]|uniref:hypothetical protein n=1 Tax=Streptomyces eurythermus TaxID=42237 RepID=UPI0036BB86C5
MVLQHMHNGKWTTLHSSATVKKDGGYALDHKFSTKADERLRVAAGTVHSPTVTVKVS